MSLDPCPSDEELLRRHAAQQSTSKREKKPPRKMDCGVDPVVASIVAPRPPRRVRARVPIQLREFRTMRGKEGWLTRAQGIITGAPRTKKNHTVAHGVQSAGYRFFELGVRRELWHACNFPPSERPGCRARDPHRFQPDTPLWLEAHFWIDSKGHAADLVGLLQGFQDALQNRKSKDAPDGFLYGLIADDRHIVSLNGSRIHYDDQKNPRVEFILSTELPKDFLR